MNFAFQFSFNGSTYTDWFSNENQMRLNDASSNKYSVVSIYHQYCSGPLAGKVVKQFVDLVYRRVTSNSDLRAGDLIISSSLTPTAPVGNNLQDHPSSGDSS